MLPILFCSIHCALFKYKHMYISTRYSTTAIFFQNLFTGPRECMVRVAVNDSILTFAFPTGQSKYLYFNLFLILKGIKMPFKSTNVYLYILYSTKAIGFISKSIQGNGRRC